MTIELRMLGWSIVLGIVYILVAATASAMVAADAGQRARAMRSWCPCLASRGASSARSAIFLKPFPFFAVAVLALAALDRYSDSTVLGAQLYFWGRLLYLPLYASGRSWCARWPGPSRPLAS